MEQAAKGPNTRFYEAVPASVSTLCQAGGEMVLPWVIFSAVELVLFSIPIGSVWYIC